MAAPAVAAAAAAPAVAAPAVAAPSDLITTFLSDYYITGLNKNSVDRIALLAVADTIHDFGMGYRNLPSQEGKAEITKFLRDGDGFIPSKLPRSSPFTDVLINGYNNIEAQNKDYFETQAGLDWITPITERVCLKDIVDHDNPVELAKTMRNNNISIELQPPANNSRYIATLKPNELTKIRDFIVTFLFEDPAVPCYFASDAQPKSVGKIFQDSSSAFGIVFPQTIADSAPTALGGSFTKNPDYYHFPTDSGAATFTSQANYFTHPSGCTIVYENGDEKNSNSFSAGTPFAWKQVITFRGKPAKDIRYGPDTGKEGPSLDQLLELQVKTRSSDGVPNVKPTKSSILKLSDFIEPIYPIIKAGITSNTHSLYLDIKRSGDQDQCYAVSCARRALGGNVALITGDITCAVKNRTYDNPTIEHLNDRIRLYRSSRTVKPLSPLEIERLLYNRLKAEYDRYHPIIKFFCGRVDARNAAIDDFTRKIIIADDTDKKEDIKAYIEALKGVPAGGCLSTELIGDKALTDISPDTLDIYTRNNTILQTILEGARGYKAYIISIQTATKGGDRLPQKSLEFLAWFVSKFRMVGAGAGAYTLDYVFDPAISNDFLNYDHTITKPPYPVLDSIVVNDINKELDNYDRALIKWCNSFFNTAKQESLLIANKLKFSYTDPAGVRHEDEDDNVMALRRLINNLYESTPTATIRLYARLGLAQKITAYWKKAVDILMKHMNNTATSPIGTETTTLKEEIRGDEILPELLKNLILDIVPAAGARASRSRAGTPSRGRGAGAGSAAAAAAAAAAAPAATGTRRSARHITQSGRGRRTHKLLQRGGALCEVDMAEELYDFFGYIAADFRTRLFTKFPELGLYVRAKALEALKLSKEDRQYILELEEINNLFVKLPGATVGNGDGDTAMAAAATPSFPAGNGDGGTAMAAADNGGVSESKDDDGNVSMAPPPPPKEELSSIIKKLERSITGIHVSRYLNMPLMSVEQEIKARQDYIDLFEETLQDKLKLATMAGCTDHIELLSYLRYQLYGEPVVVVGIKRKRGRESPDKLLSLTNFMITVAVANDILTNPKDNSTFYKLIVRPELTKCALYGNITGLTGGSIDLKSNNGVQNTLRFLQNFGESCLDNLRKSATVATAAKRIIEYSHDDDDDDTNDNVLSNVSTEEAGAGAGASKRKRINSENAGARAAALAKAAALTRVTPSSNPFSRIMRAATAAGASAAGATAVAGAPKARGVPFTAMPTAGAGAPTSTFNPFSRIMPAGAAAGASAAGATAGAGGAAAGADENAVMTEAGAADVASAAGATAGAGMPMILDGGYRRRRTHRRYSHQQFKRHRRKTGKR